MIYTCMVSCFMISSRTTHLFIICVYMYVVPCNELWIGSSRYISYVTQNNFSMICCCVEQPVYPLFPARYIPNTNSEISLGIF
uniref:Uncharacterized protein n=1 Tax=Arundo donax TaxID=35708 RepID=A0A0A9GF86_ARUDO